MFFWFKQKEKHWARTLYTQACEAARTSALFPQSIPDTPDGHFFSLSLHLLLLLKHLEGQKERKQAQACAWYLFAFLCQEMDDHLRENGMGDVAVSKNVKHMAATFSFYQKCLFPVLGKGTHPIEAAIKSMRQETDKHPQLNDAMLAIYIEEMFARLQKHNPLVCAQKKHNCGFRHKVA